MLYVDIKKELGDFTLNIEMEAREETLALFGASGCGKTLTLKCIAGIEKPDEGEIILGDKILFSSKKKINLPAQKRKIGLLFQNYALFPNMTLEENIAIAIPKDRPNKGEIIREKIREFSLRGLEKNYPHQLSGGQQQRTALARMLVNEPEILMLDEAFSALDGHLRWKMEQKLSSALKSYGKTALYVSHNKDEVYRMADRIAILNRGTIQLIGEKEEIFSRPKNVNTAKLAGCKNISKAKKAGRNRVYAVDWGFEVETEEAVGDNIKYIGIFSNNLELARTGREEEKKGHSSAFYNSFPMRIVNRIDNPFSSVLVLEYEKNTSPSYRSYVYMEVHRERGLLQDIDFQQPIYVHFKQDKLLLLY